MTAPRGTRKPQIDPIGALYDPDVVTNVLLGYPRLAEAIAGLSGEGVVPRSFPRARISYRQIYRILTNAHYDHLVDLLAMIEYCLERDVAPYGLLRTRARKSFVESLADLEAAYHFLQQGFKVRTFDETKDQASVPDLLITGHGMDVAVEVYCPRQWESLDALNDVSAAFKNLDVPYDFDADVDIRQLDRFDAHGVVQLHPAEIAHRLSADVRQSVMADLLRDADVALRQQRSGAAITWDRVDLNLGVHLALSSIEPSHGVLPRRRVWLSPPALTGHDPLAMFEALVDRRVRSKAMKHQAVGHASTSLLLVDLSHSSLVDELRHPYYYGEFEAALQRLFASGIEGYDMLALCEWHGRDHTLHPHFIVHEDGVSESMLGLLFSDQLRA